MAIASIASLPPPQPTPAPLPPPAASTPAAAPAEGSTIHQDLDLSTLKKIGEGAYGHIYSVYDTRVKTTIVIKTLKYVQDKSIFKQEFENCKFVMLKKVRHAIQVIGNITDFRHPLLTTPYGILFPKNGYSLQLALQTKVKLSIDHVVWIAHQILEMLEDLHRLHKAHRDLTPRNLLINDATEITVIDWAGLISIPSHHMLPCTAANYRAPEEFMRHGKTFDGAIDIWAFGCILYMTLTRKLLFPANDSRPFKDDESIVTAMVTELGTPSDTFLKSCTNSFPYFRPQSNGKFDFLFSCLGERGEAETRMREALVSPEIHASPDQVEGMVTLFTSCLRWDPKERITAEQALKLPLFQQEPRGKK